MSAKGFDIWTWRFAERKWVYWSWKKLMIFFCLFSKGLLKIWPNFPFKNIQDRLSVVNVQYLSLTTEWREKLFYSPSMELSQNAGKIYGNWVDPLYMPPTIFFDSKWNPSRASKVEALLNYHSTKYNQNHSCNIVYKYMMVDALKIVTENKTLLLITQPH